MRETTKRPGPGRNKGHLDPWEGRACNTAIWLGGNVVSLLKALCAQEGRSVSDLIREAIREYLKARGVKIKE